MAKKETNITQIPQEKKILSPAEAAQKMFLLLCEQYHQMGNQLANLGEVIDALIAEGGK